MDMLLMQLDKDLSDFRIEKMIARHNLHFLFFFFFASPRGREKKKKENIFLKLFISNLLALSKVVILNIL